MTPPSVRVRVPASSANLGPGFDSFAAALAPQLELVVSASDGFALTSDLLLPTDRTNLVTRAFEVLHPLEDLHFRVSSEIPLSGGLGASAAAIVAGLVAAARFAGTGDADLLGLATELEGHPDNVAAALYGGIVICAEGEVHRLTAPPTLAALLVVPDEGVTTTAARAALPEHVPLADAVYNTAHGALLMLGLAQGDLDLIARGLHDRLHEPYRTQLYPRSAELAARARELGALGATISGAGPSVLFWVADEQSDALRAALESHAAGWAQVLSATFTDLGAAVLETAG